MSEKGGKGSSLPSKVSLSGKDGSSVKSKRGRKVRFDTEAEPKFKFLSDTNGKFQNAASKGDWSTFGKRDKAGKGGKTSAADQPLELRLEKELPENVTCLMDCEAANILEGIQDQMVVLSEDPTIKIPVSFAKGLQYAKTGSRYTNPHSVRQLLDTLKKHGVSDGEICVIANVYPENIDEVFALVPSLKAKRSLISEPLKEVVYELSKLKKSS